jgi:putative nucleotidyltransferase with HDIG domain
MESLQGTLQAPAMKIVPPDLVQNIFQRTGVAVFLFSLKGESLTGPAEAAAALAPLVRQAAQRQADQIVSEPGRTRAAWVVRHRGRPMLMAAAEVAAEGDEAQALAQRLLAAAAEVLRVSVAESFARSEAGATAESLLQSYEEISLLHSLGDVLRVNRPVADLLRQMCEELRQTTGAEATAAYLPAGVGEEAEAIVVGRLPFPAEDLPGVIRHFLEGSVPDDGSGPVMINNHCQNDPTLAGLSLTLKRLVVVPLATGAGAACGALLAANRPTPEFGSPDAKLIRSTASASGIFIENRRLYRDLQDIMLDLVRSLVSSVDAKDPYTCGHSERVAITCRSVAAQLGLPPEAVETAYLAGLLHDIGKIGTPEYILRKEGRLEPEERMIMIRHSEIGARILAGVRKLEPIREAVLYHHERLDGSGYPSGLAGDQIPLMARIVGLADAFDAMTSNRPYRPMLPLEQVKLEIRRCMGTQFDEAAARALLSLDLHQLMRAFVERPTTVCI